MVYQEQLSRSELERLEILRSYEVVDAKGSATLDNALAICAFVAGVRSTFMAMVDADRLVFKATLGFNNPSASGPRKGSFADLVIKNDGRPLIVNDAKSDARFCDHPLGTGPRFFAGFPIVAAEEHVVGVLACVDEEPRELTQKQIDTLELVAENTMVSFELRRTLFHAHRMALTDTLTGIGNRHAFFETAARTLTRQKTGLANGALLFVDLDGFKRLNDTCGHQAGDQALRIVADCLSRNIRHSDFAARIGGDEFAILIVDCDDYVAISERLREQISTEMVRRGWSVTASVGLLTFQAAPSSVTDALAAGDSLMY